MVKKTRISRTIDIKQACCYDTATQPIKDILATMEPDEALEVIAKPNFRVILHRFAESEGYNILEETERADEICFIIKKAEPASDACCEAFEKEERKLVNCMICGGSLDYLTEATSATCYYCGKVESTYIRCPNGHYVCEGCHGKGAYEAIKDLAFSTDLKDPIAIAEIMMSHPSISMLGCEHAIITSAAFLAALKNEASLKIKDYQIIDAMDRAKNISKSGYCGIAGTCGVASGLAAAFSVVLGAACSKDVETSITLHVMARATDAIANDAGPCCCKSFVRTAMGVGYNLAKEYLKVELPIHREKISCIYVKRHPHGCRTTRCNYFPKTKIKTKDENGT